MHGLTRGPLEQLLSRPGLHVVIPYAHTESEVDGLHANHMAVEYFRRKRADSAHRLLSVAVARTLRQVRFTLDTQASSAIHMSYRHKHAETWRRLLLLFGAVIA